MKEGSYCPYCSDDPERNKSIAHAPPHVYKTKWLEKYSCQICRNIFDKDGKKVWNMKEDGTPPEWWKKSSFY